MHRPQVKENSTEGKRTLLSDAAHLWNVGELTAAHRIYSNLISNSPSHHEAQFGNAGLALQVGKFAASLRLAKRAAALAPARVEYRLLMADAEAACGNYSHALALLRSIRLDGKRARMYAKRMTFWARLSKNALLEAISLRRWRAVLPDDPQCLAQLVTWLVAQERHREALPILALLVQQEPQSDLHHRSAASIYHLIEKLDESLLAARRAVTLDPSSPENWIGLAIALAWNLQQEKSIRAAAVALGSGLASRNIEYNAAEIYLSAGKLTIGWDLYSTRRERDQQQYAPPVGIPRWNGEDLSGKSILIIGEQGVGDEILFSTCYNDVIAQAKSTTILARQRLLNLFRRSFHRSKVVQSYNVTDSPHDFYVHSGDLPRLIRQEPADFDPPPPLHPDPTMVATWRDWLSQFDTKLYVGLSWTSGLVTTGRSPDLTTLADWLDVLKVPGITFVSVQYGQHDEEIEMLRHQIGVTIQQPPNINIREDLDNLAALTSVLDIVVSTASTAGHLAASVGTPVWMLLRRGTPFLFGREDYLFHPTLRPILRDCDEDWSRSIKIIEERLRQLVLSTSGGIS